MSEPGVPFRLLVLLMHAVYDSGAEARESTALSAFSSAFTEARANRLHGYGSTQQYY